MLKLFNAIVVEKLIAYNKQITNLLYVILLANIYAKFKLKIMLLVFELFSWPAVFSISHKMKINAAHSKSS